MNSPTTAVSNVVRAFHPSAAERFWAKVHRSTDVDCWPWRGYVSDRGYGKFSISHTQQMRAHRVAFYLTFGYWPDVVMHLCDNRRCCNPFHLQAGTQTDNMTDMRQKGRGSKPPPHIGERSAKAKLSEDAVRAIRASDLSLKVLAAQYGVGLSTISAIRTRQNWRHI